MGNKNYKIAKPKQLKFKFKGLKKNNNKVNNIDYELESRKHEFLMKIDKFIIL